MSTHRYIPASRRRRRHGFTLVEMMVALTIGALVIGTVYTIGSSAARHFHEQQRISQLQLSVRLALDRIRRDVARAGFLGTMDSRTDRTCGPPLGTIIHAIDIVDAQGTAAFVGQPGFVPGVSQADAVTITGNFRTGDAYRIRSWSNFNMELATTWQAYRRSFSQDPSTNVMDPALVQATFARDTPLLVRGPSGLRVWTTSAGADADTGGTRARISTTTAYQNDACRVAVPGLNHFCADCTVAPVSAVRYEIVRAAPPLGPTPAMRPITGENTVLMRTEINPVTGAVLDGPMPVLEYAVHFDIDAYVDTAAGANPTAIALRNDVEAQLATINTPARIRGVRISLAARTARQDPQLSEGLAPLADGTPRVFDVFGRGPGSGAARVRSAYTEVFLPNMALSE
ncbi:MAG: hypothetical protein OHK0013_18910 [Sandaracinaceae bacterium]